LVKKLGICPNEREVGRKGQLDRVAFKFVSEIVRGARYDLRKVNRLQIEVQAARFHSDHV
jgi:hypothetical protein